MDTINLSKLSNLIQAINSENISPDWIDTHTETIEKMCKALPHGSGIDGKCELQMENCKRDKLVFFVEFHHMDENGYYDGWTEHNIILTPSFIFGYDMRITGKDKNGIKDYLHQIFSEIFSLNSDTCPVS